MDFLTIIKTYFLLVETTTGTFLHLCNTQKFFNENFKYVYFTRNTNLKYSVLRINSKYTVFLKKNYKGNFLYWSMY